MKLEPSRARQTAPLLVKGPSEADTKTVSPSRATAREYEACRPSVVHDHDSPPSVLQPKPTAAATAPCPPAARTSCTSASGSTAPCHVSPPSSDHHTPPTW